MKFEQRQESVRRSIAIIALSCMAVSACSTNQAVLIAKAAPDRKVVTVARMPEEDNSPQMDGYLESALQKQGLEIKAPVPAGTRKAAGLDAIVSYVDVWRWDIVTYLKQLTVRLYDATTGDLLATGEWKDSPLHGFRDPDLAVQGLVSEMFSKLRAATVEK